MRNRTIALACWLTWLAPAAVSWAQLGPIAIEPVFAGASPKLSELLASPRAMTATTVSWARLPRTAAATSRSVTR